MDGRRKGHSENVNFFYGGSMGAELDPPKEKLLPAIFDPFQLSYGPEILRKGGGGSPDLNFKSCLGWGSPPPNEGEPPFEISSHGFGAIWLQCHIPLYGGCWDYCWLGIGKFPRNFIETIFRQIAPSVFPLTPPIRLNC